MSEISQRQLRNDNAEVMRGVERGESYIVTRRGVPVARLLPVGGSDLRCDSPATRRGGWAALAREDSHLDTAALLDELRADR